MSKLLLVEDDNNLREIYEARLQAEGYTIVTAKDGEEALVVAKAERPDLIISDIMMPKISGFEMLDILRNTENLKNVPVIMLTALGQNDDQQRADKLGADRYLVKSQVTLEDIVRVAHELLGDSQKAAEPATVESSLNSTPPATPPPAASTPPEPSLAPTVPSTHATDLPAANPEVPSAPVPEAPPTMPTPPTPTSANTVSTTPPIAPTVATDDDKEATAAATTTVQEGADVKARIEDFVTGASQDATPPNQSAVTDQGETPSTSIDTAPVDSSASNQEPTKADAQNTDSSTQTISPTTSPAESAASSTDTTAPVPPSSEASDAPATAAPTNTAAVVHDKVITPLETSPKKDIHTLLALEAAKEANNAAEPPASPVIVDNSQTSVQSTPTADSQTATLGATKPTPPNTVITPAASDDNSSATVTSTDTTEVSTSLNTPTIAPPASAITQPGGEEAGTDLNNIAL
jgi:CheY-like chemotaxis protein